MERQEILNQISEAFGSVPGYCTEMPDAVLEQFWTTNVWFSSDTTLSARDKALVAFGAAAGVTCEYWIPYHTAQLALNGMGKEHVVEASWAAQMTVGFSSYFHGVGYSKETFQQEVDAVVEYIQSSA